MVTNEFLAKVAERSRQAYAQRMEQERREAGRADGMATRIFIATGVGETEIYLYRPLQSKRTLKDVRMKLYRQKTVSTQRR